MVTEAVYHMISEVWNVVKTAFMIACFVGHHLIFLYSKDNLVFFTSTLIFVELQKHIFHCSFQMK